MIYASLFPLISIYTFRFIPGTRAAEHASDAAPQPAEAAPKKESDLDLRNTVLRRLAASPADPRELAAGCSCAPERLARVVRELLEEGKIVGDKGGILKIIP